MIEDDDVPAMPGVEEEAEEQRMQALLGHYAAVARGIGEWTPRDVAPVRRRRRLASMLAGGLAAGVLLVAAHLHRVAWNDGQPWKVTYAIDSGARHRDHLAPGETLATDARQSLTIAVARIGRITLSPDSTLRLLETRSGRHRVRLDVGHLRARIWAPPESFGVTDGTTEVIDLGCDFDLWKHADGSGRILVHSGWVAWRLASQEVLLPAGFGMRFDAMQASTPVRLHASRAFAHALETLDAALAQPGPLSGAAHAAADSVAERADDADAFSLLSLLSRHPSLAGGALYARLARALGTPADDARHRAAWTTGDHDAIDTWWRKLPTRPKTWWLNWSDVLD